MCFPEDPSERSLPAALVLEVCRRLRARTGLHQVALLEQAGFERFFHSQVPANDGGQSLGQTMIAAHSFAPRKE